MRTLLCIVILAGACTRANPDAVGGGGGNGGGGGGSAGSGGGGGGSAGGGGTGGGDMSGDQPKDMSMTGPADMTSFSGVYCGNNICMAPTNECCASANTLTCIPPAQLCNGNAYDCDGPEDCKTGQTCCGGGTGSTWQRSRRRQLRQRTRAALPHARRVPQEQRRLRRLLRLSAGRPHPLLQQDGVSLRAVLLVALVGCGHASTSTPDLGSTTGVPCADTECAPCADQFCDTADFGKTGMCRAHEAATHQSFGCDGPEDCVAQGVFGACCMLEGIGAACSTAGCGSGGDLHVPWRWRLRGGGALHGAGGGDDLQRLPLGARTLRGAS